MPAGAEKGPVWLSWTLINMAPPVRKCIANFKFAVFYNIKNKPENIYMLKLLFYTATKGCDLDRCKSVDLGFIHDSLKLKHKNVKRSVSHIWPRPC